jgi:hypothetical protein
LPSKLRQYPHSSILDEYAQEFQTGSRYLIANRPADDCRALSQGKARIFQEMPNRPILAYGQQRRHILPPLV